VSFWREAAVIARGEPPSAMVTTSREKLDQSAFKPGSVGPGRPVEGPPDVAAIPLGRSLPMRLEQPTRATGLESGPARPLAGMSVSPLFGLAPGGVCRAVRVAASAVRSYRTLSPLPCSKQGGLLSVALSLGSPPPDVIRHRLSMEPGLSSPGLTPGAAARPTDPARMCAADRHEVKGGDAVRRVMTGFSAGRCRGRPRNAPVRQTRRTRRYAGSGDRPPPTPVPARPPAARGPPRLTRSRCSPWTPTAPAAAWLHPSAAARWRCRRGTSRRPCCRRAGAG